MKILIFGALTGQQTIKIGSKPWGRTRQSINHQISFFWRFSKYRLKPCGLIFYVLKLLLFVHLRSHKPSKSAQNPRGKAQIIGFLVFFYSLPKTLEPKLLFFGKFLFLGLQTHEIGTEPSRHIRDSLILDFYQVWRKL